MRKTPNPNATTWPVAPRCVYYTVLCFFYDFLSLNILFTFLHLDKDENKYLILASSCDVSYYTLLYIFFSLFIGFVDRQEKVKSKSFILATFCVFDGTADLPPELELPGVEEFYFHIQPIGLRQLAAMG